MDSSKCFKIPQRVVMGIMGFTAIVVAYTLRVCLSVAITEMVVPINNSKKNNTSIVCPVDSWSPESNGIEKIDGPKYDWTQEQQGWIFSSFYIGYIITHIPGAILAQKFGGKWILSLGILIISFCSAVTPLSIDFGGYKALILIRIMMGLAGGTSFPALSVLLAAWVPKKERGKLASIVLGGGQLGSLLSNYVSGQILYRWPWPVVFYFWSCVSIVWFIIFIFTCYNDPASHPFISKTELVYLKSEMGELKRNDDLPPTPWKSVLNSSPVIALIIAQVCNDWVFYIITSYLPKYMKEVLGFSVRDVGLYSSLPYLLKWIISISSGFLCDYLISKKYVTTTNIRKIVAGLCGILPASFILAASYAGCNKLIVVIWFTLGMGFLGLYYSSLRINIFDLSPNYAASLMAVANGAASFSGVVAPTFVGMMTPDSSLEQWKFVFWISFGVAMFRILIYSIWASGEVQPWNNSKQNDSPETYKLTENNEFHETKKTSS